MDAAERIPCSRSYGGPGYRWAGRGLRPQGSPRVPGATVVSSKVSPPAPAPPPSNPAGPVPSASEVRGPRPSRTQFARLALEMRGAPPAGLNADPRLSSRRSPWARYLALGWCRSWAVGVHLRPEGLRGCQPGTRRGAQACCAAGGRRTVPVIFSSPGADLRDRVGQDNECPRSLVRELLSTEAWP